MPAVIRLCTRGSPEHPCMPAIIPNKGELGVLRERVNVTFEVKLKKKKSD